MGDVCSSDAEENKTVLVSRDACPWKRPENPTRFFGLFFWTGTNHSIGIEVNMKKRATSLISLCVTVAKWFHRTTVAPETKGRSVPPIRFDGDPTDIYLA